MNTISNERLEEISQCSDVTTLFAYEQRHMARELLALRKEREAAVPVGWMTDVEVDELHRGLAEEAYIYRLPDTTSTIPLYAAPPAQPVAVPDDKSITAYFDTLALDTARDIMCDVNRRSDFLGGDVQLLSRIQCRIDTACRATMLNQAPVKQPASNYPVIPEGCALVPIEPTDEMCKAFDYSNAWKEVDFWEGSFDLVSGWRAMLAAAPKQESE